MTVVTAADLAYFRGLAVERMEQSGRATVRRKSGSTTVDGMEVPTWTTVASGVPFRVSAGNASLSTPGATRRQVVGNVETMLASRVGHFPASFTDLADNDLIEVTAGENTGLVLRVVEATWLDQSTARRVPVVEVQRPEEW